MKAGIYARVLTADQDLKRQLYECYEHLDSNYPDIGQIDEYADIISGADKTGVMSITDYGTRLRTATTTLL